MITNFKIIETIHPMFGNKHCTDYYKLQVSDSETGETKILTTKGDLVTDKARMFPNGEYKLCQYITFQRKPYEVVTFYEGSVRKLKLVPLF